MTNHDIANSIAVDSRKNSVTCVDLANLIEEVLDEKDAMIKAYSELSYKYYSWNTPICTGEDGEWSCDIKSIIDEEAELLVKKFREENLK